VAHQILDRMQTTDNDVKIVETATGAITTVAPVMMIAAAEPGVTPAVTISATPIPSAPPAYYYVVTKGYWLPTVSGRYIELFRSDLEDHLVAAGLSPQAAKGQWLSPVDRCILNIQQHWSVDFAGPLAGHRMGFVQMGQTRCLITSEPVFVKPQEGSWSLLQGILERMLGAEQLVYLLAWIKLTLAMFASRVWQPGQVLVLCGEAGAGKNLLTAILGVLFGGRMPGKPYRFMTGRTDFNGDFFGCELLTIEDEAESTGIHARRAFGSAIKMMTANHVQWMHAKNRQALSVNVMWRIVVSVNDDPERMMVLPLIEADTEDKIMLLKVAKKPLPRPTSTVEEQRVFWDELMAELPAFVHYINEWTIPDVVKAPRFGVKHYHHPDLLAALQELSPERKLLELIDEFVLTLTFKGDKWQGRAAELDRLLKGNSDVRCSREAEKLLPSMNSCGKYLGRLERLHPDRIAQRTSNGRTIWTVLMPPELVPVTASSELRAKIVDRPATADPAAASDLQP
jgi:hypothetical protein